jgi:SEC-C motif-containing protein
MKKISKSESCVCGSGVSFGQCCSPVLAGLEKAKTAQALMRSRYAAYVVGDIEHIKKTQNAKSGGDFDEANAKEWSEKSEWNGLEIVRTEKGLAGDETGIVEFKARFKFEGKEACHHETAFFKREAGEWNFVEGKVAQEPYRLTEPKLGRNDLCSCGSGKKFKKCCLVTS